MHGPIAAAIAAGSAPRPTMAATVASITPATAPRQPAWAAPATPAARVGKQDGRAVGGDDAESDVGACRHHRIGARAVARSPRRRHLDDLGAMHLHEADQTLRFGADGAGGAGAILQHRVARIAPREAAIEAGVRSAGDAALAREEAMRNTERVGGQRHGRLLTVAWEVVQGVSLQTRAVSGRRGCTAPGP